MADLYDGMTPEEWAASCEDDAFESTTKRIFWSILHETHDSAEDGVDPQKLQRRIIDGITMEAFQEYLRGLAEVAAAAEVERNRVDVAVVRKTGDIGATWHRKLTDKSTACGKPIPEDPETGDIGDKHVIRSFLCGACMRYPDNLGTMRMRREHQERNRRP